MDGWSIAGCYYRFIYAKPSIKSGHSQNFTKLRQVRQHSVTPRWEHIALLGAWLVKLASTWLNPRSGPLLGRAVVKKGRNEGLPLLPWEVLLTCGCTTGPLHAALQLCSNCACALPWTSPVPTLAWLPWLGLKSASALQPCWVMARLSLILTTGPGPDPGTDLPSHIPTPCWCSLCFWLPYYCALLLSHFPCRAAKTSLFWHRQKRKYWKAKKGITGEM